MTIEKFNYQHKVENFVAMEMISFFVIILLTLLLFCAYVAFAQWRNTRDGATPWYIGYLLAADFHYFRQFWIDLARDHGYPYPPDLPLRWDSPLSYLSLCCYILFLAKILDFQQQAPKLNRLFQFFARFYLVMLLVHLGMQLIWGYSTANLLYQGARILMFPLMGYTIVFLFRQTIHFYQKLILIGCLFLVGGMFSAILTELVPWHDPLIDIIRVFHTPWGNVYFYHMKVGIFFDVICFSWALTLLQKQKMAQSQSDSMVIAPNAARFVAVAAENSPAPHLEDDLIDKVMAFLGQNFGDENMGVPQLAKAVHLSPSQTNRRIKEKTGLTTEQFIRQYRLAQAYQQLSFTSKSIAEVTTEVGFKDVSHFSTSFKKQYGLNPSKIRRNSANVEKEKAKLAH